MRFNLELIILKPYHKVLLILFFVLQSQLIVLLFNFIIFQVYLVGQISHLLLIFLAFNNNHLLPYLYIVLNASFS